MTFHIKTEFPKRYDTNVDVLDLDNKGAEFHPVYFYEAFNQARIWIDGVEITSRRAGQLRRGFSHRKVDFTWGRESYSARVTALAICLQIFDTEQTAVNMYLPFMREVMCHWERKSFEATVDLFAFISNHPERMLPTFSTKYFKLGQPASNHEINFISNLATGVVTARVADLVCETLVEEQRRIYEWRGPAAILGLEVPPEHPFDWELAYKWKWGHIVSVWPSEDELVIVAGTLRQAVAKTRSCLRKFAAVYSSSRLYLERYRDLVRYL